MARKHIINVHTGTGTTEPSGATLYLGEIAVQHTSTDPALWIKVGTSESSTDYEKFIGRTEITNLINDSKILGSGYTYSGISYVNSATTIADAYSALTNELILDELTISAALNDLNGRVDEVGGDVTTLSGVVADMQNDVADISGLSAATVTLQQNVSGLSGVTVELSEDVTELSAETVTISASVHDMGVVVAASLNDLNARVIELSGRSVDLTPLYELSAGTVQIESAMSEMGEVVAASLNDLNVRVIELSGRSVDLTPLYELSAETIVIESAMSNMSYVVAASLNDLNDRVDELSGRTVDLSPLSASVVTNRTNISELSASTVSLSAETVIISASVHDMGVVVAASLNDLNERIIELSGNSVSGDFVEKSDFGQYSAETAALLNSLSATIEDDGYVISHAINDLNDRLNELSGNSGSVEEAIAPLSAAVQSLSAAVITVSANTGGGGGTDVSPLSAAVISLSAATTAHSADSTVHITSAERTKWNNAWTSGVSAYTKVEQLSAVTITGVSMNGSNVTVTDKVATLGTVVTAQTQLSTATTGTGNVMTDITVSNHQITKNYGMTIPTWATATTKPSYTASEVGALPTGTTLDNVADGSTRKLSDYATTGTVNNLSAVTVTGVSAGGTNVTVTNKVAAIPSASSSTFGVVKTGNYITNTNGSIAVSTGTTNTTVARGDQFLAVSGATTANTANLKSHSATTIASSTSSGMHLPTVTSNDNGKVLQVVNGAWSLVTPVTVYSGNDAPNNNMGQNGDIYLQV